MNFITRLQAVVDTLKNDPDYEIIQYEVFAPAEGEIEAVEKELGYALSSEIKDFYSQCNGLKLIWISARKDEDGYMSETADYYLKNKAEITAAKENFFVLQSGDYYMPPDGAIIIPGIRQVFCHDWSSLIFDAADTVRSFGDQGILDKPGIREEQFNIQPFDLYNEYNHISFLLTGNDNPYLVFSDDAFASFSEGRPITFSDYLDILITSKGSIDERESMVKKEYDDEDNNDDEDDDV